MDDPDAVHAETRTVGNQHRPRRVVPLAVGRGACLDEYRAVAEEFDGAVLATWHPGGAIDEDRQADAELLALTGGPATALLGPKLVVSRRVEDCVEGPNVITAVVDETRGARPGKGVGGDEVSPPHVGGIEAGPRREEVDGAVHDRRRLGPARAPVGRDGSRVGEHALVGPRHLGDVIRAGQQVAGVVGQVGGDACVRAAVGDDVDLEGADDAVGRPANTDLLNLGAGVAEADHVVGTVRDPAHRSTASTGQQRKEQLLRIRPTLGPEAPTHVGGDDLDLGLVQTVGGGQLGADGVGALTRGEMPEPPLVGPHRCRHPRLDRTRCHSLVDEGGLDDDVARSEVRRLGVAAAVARHHVGAGIGKQEVGSRHRVSGADDDGQWFVVDLDHGDCVGGLGCRFGHDCDDRFAHEADDAVGEERPGHRRVRRRHHRRQRSEAVVGGGDDVDDAGRSGGRRHVDGREAGVGRRRCHVRHVQRVQGARRRRRSGCRQ